MRTHYIRYKFLIGRRNLVFGGGEGKGGETNGMGRKSQYRYTLLKILEILSISENNTSINREYR